MTETIGVMFVFLLLVIFGFLFYMRFQAASFEGVKTEEYGKRSIDVAQRSLTLPELQCSSDNIIIDDCMDIVKLTILSNMMKESSELQNDYYDKFQSSTIQIQQVYPSKNAWTVYNRSVNATNRFATQIPISLYDPMSKRYSFGVMNLTYYIISGQ